MCGFAGVYARGNVRASEHAASERAAGVLPAMSHSIGHRGPDDETFLVEPPVHLAFRRLAIVDAQGGRQPIWNESRTICVVANAEIYNHKELRAERLGAHVFQTASDVECLVHLYEEVGIDLFALLIGKFAVAIWDRPRRRLVLGRDPLGVKPLYYAETADGLLFGSEIKALLTHPACPRARHWHGQGGRVGPGSHLAGVTLLPGGMCATCTDDDLRLHEYWNIRRHFWTGGDIHPADRYVEEYGDLFQDSVRKRLMSDDGPMGAFLSGGVDSATVVAVASAARKAAGQAPPHCFTILERSTFLAGDADAAERLARSLGAEPHLVLFDDEHLCETLEVGLHTLEYYVWLLDAPCFSLEYLLKHELHRYAKTVVPDLKVMLLGQGADEFSGGYSCIASRSVERGWREYIDQAVLPAWRTTLATQAGIPARLQPFLSTAYCERLADAAPASWYHRQMLLFVTQLQHMNLWHEDRTSAAQGVEARVPFLDHRLVQHLAAIPPEHHEALFWNKTIIRRMAARWLPGWLRERPKVPLFGVQDRSSVYRILSAIVRRTYPEFRRAYLDRPGAMFVAAPLDRAYLAIASGRAEPSVTELLLDCMTGAIFDRLTRDPAAQAAIVRPVPPSPLTALASVAAAPWRRGAGGA